MNKEQPISAAQSGPTTSADSWGLRHSGLVMGKGGRNEVKEFTGIWRGPWFRKNGAQQLSARGHSSRL